MRYAFLALLSLAIVSTSSAQRRPGSTRVVVKGLAAKAEVLVDRWGVAHIYAGNSADAFLVQGWNAARDRLWQMDLWRRTGLGELAAVLGEKYVAEDRAIRLFVYRGDMEKEWAAYGPEARRATEAFVAGINAYIAAVRRDAKLLPPEFVLAGYQPALWQAEDVVRVRNHVIAFGLRLSIGRAQMVCKDGSATTQLLPVVSPPWTPVVPEGLDLCSIPPNVLDQYNLGKGSVAFAKPGLTPALRTPPDPSAINGRGSNNWVIGPRKSATGRPILANDPHWVVSAPAPFYLAHVSAPGLNFIGGGEPTVPGFLIGHNEHFALGATLFFMAQEDLYVYDTDPENPNRYRYGNGWESMRVVHESVGVRGGPARDVLLKFTRHGPVVMEDSAHRRAYAVRATWLDPGGAPYLGAMRYLRATSTAEVASALKPWGEPTLNSIAADTKGTIGWFPSGFAPKRPNTDGLLPLPGDGGYEWDGYLAPDLLPSELNPARGYIATANHMNLPKGYPYQARRLSFFWIDDSRFNRITEVLEGLPKVSVEDSKRLQNDYVTFPGRRLVRLLGMVAGSNPRGVSDPEVGDMGKWLASWDANVTARSGQAALYEVWVARHLTPAFFAKAVSSLPPRLQALSTDEELLPIVEFLEHPDKRLGEHPEAARDDLLLSTLAAAVAETKTLLGPDRAKWQWGQLSTILFEHALSPLANPTQRAAMTIGPAPKDGDSNVPGVAEFDHKSFRTIGVATLRVVMDVGNWDQSVAVNGAGQSGDWTSPHYRDLFPMWLAGKYFPLLYTRRAIEQATERRIELAPGSE
jgi:penicillin amidase